MRKSLKRAQEKYMMKKKSEGWRNIRFFIPPDIKIELMQFKTKLMEKHYEKCKRNVI